MKSARWWVPALLVVLALGAGMTIGIFGPLKVPNPIPQPVIESRSTQIINAVTREEQVVLLSLGVSDIEEQTAKFDFNGWEIPGTERLSLLQFSFTAKLGIEGDDVEIAPTGENRFLISIPEFIFIGHDDLKLGAAVENNGVLSWATPEISEAEIVELVLGGESAAEYVETHTETLKEQAESFYASIISSIDPKAVVEFEFR